MFKEELYFMDAPFQYNSATVNINTDATLVAILSRFSSDYIMDVINNSIDNKFRPYGDPAPNIVYGYEEQFKYLMQPIFMVLWLVMFVQISSIMELVILLVKT